MPRKVEAKGLAGQDTDSDKYLRKFAPKRGQGDGPYNPFRPWLRDYYENGFQVLWEAVKRLEEISHNGKTSAAVCGPVHRAEVGGPDLAPPSAAAAAGVPVSPDENAVCQPMSAGPCAGAAGQDRERRRPAAVHPVDGPLRPLRGAPSAPPPSSAEGLGRLRGPRRWQPPPPKALRAGPSSPAGRRLPVSEPGWPAASAR